MKRWVVAVALMLVACVAGINNPSMVPGGEPPRYRIYVVVHDGDRRPIVGGHVAMGLYVFPATGNDGETVANIPMGKYTMAVSAPGYCGQLWTVNLVESASYGVALDKCEQPTVGGW